LFYINNAGQIAGTTLDLNGKEVAFIWDRARDMRTLGTLGGAESVARGLNNRGQVVGWSRTAAGLKHAFVWDQTAGMQDLGTPEGDGGEARAINDSGQIVGVSDEEPGRPALWTSTGPVAATGQLRGLFGFSDINNHGYTAGRQSFRDGADFMVLWRQGDSPKKLFQIDQEINLWPVINDANQILFAELRWNWSKLIDRTRFIPGTYYLWDPNHGRIPLNRHVLAKRGERLELFDLNNSGCMVGRVLGPGMSYVRAVLLEPIPERWRK
jgi:probable HAF family extracellular repeat protein